MFTVSLPGAAPRPGLSSTLTAVQRSHEVGEAQGASNAASTSAPGLCREKEPARNCREPSQLPRLSHWYAWPSVSILPGSPSARSGSRAARTRASEQRSAKVASAFQQAGARLRKAAGEVQRSCSQVRGEDGETATEATQRSRLVFSLGEARKRPCQYYREALTGAASIPPARVSVPLAALSGEMGRIFQDSVPATPRVKQPACLCFPPYFSVITCIVAIARRIRVSLKVQARPLPRSSISGS